MAEYHHGQTRSKKMQKRKEMRAIRSRKMQRVEKMKIEQYQERQTENEKESSDIYP